MTNVRRPVHLQLHQRPSPAMVSSSSGSSPFGVESSSGGGGANNSSHATPGASQNGATATVAPARSTPIRPNALINFNCLAQTPTIPSNLASPMQGNLMMLSSPRSARLGGARTTCCPPGNEPHASLTTPMSPSAGGHLPPFYNHHTKALSPTGLNDSMPSQIMPHLFVGNQEQTNRETVNKLNIKYILSLGLLPMIVANQTSNTSVATLSPNSPVSTIGNNGKKISSATRSATKNHSHNHHHHHYHHQAQNLMPPPNSSRDFKIRIRSNTPTTPTTPLPATTLNSPFNTASSCCLASPQPPPSSSGVISPTAIASSCTITKTRDENKGIKAVRSVYCKCINIADNSDQLLSKFFDEAFMFIEEARRKKCNILIHCLAGISRSPTIAIAYLMRIRSLHWKDAYDLVKQCRPQIDPNLNFMGQLRIYNKSLRDEHSVASRQTNDSLTTITNDCHNTPLIKSGMAHSCCVDANSVNSIVSHELTNTHRLDMEDM